MRFDLSLSSAGARAYSRAKRQAFAIAAATLAFCIANHARAAALQWAGRSWNVTSGGMAGVAEGSPSNVSVDENGYLHLKITKSGNTWTAAELFTTEKLGFGTYQWQVDGPIDRFDSEGHREARQVKRVFPTTLSPT
jgi:hypothetical protein